MKFKKQSLIQRFRTFKNLQITLLIACIFLLQLFSVSIINQNVANFHDSNTNTNSKKNNNNDSITNNSLLTNQSKNLFVNKSKFSNTTATTNLPIFDSNSKLTSTTTITSSSSTSTSTWRVDYTNYVTPATISVPVTYNYDPIFPTVDFVQYPIISTGRYSIIYNGFPSLVAIDSIWGYTQLFETGTAARVVGDLNAHFEVGSLTSGIIYCYNCYYYTSGSVTSPRVTIDIASSSGWTSQNLGTLTTTDYSWSSFQVTAGQINIMFEHDFTPSATTDAYDIGKYDAFYFQPNSVSAKPVENIVNNNNGTYTHYITVNPVALTTTTGVQVTIPSGWTYVSASNPASSAVVSSGVLTIKGLPAEQTTNLVFRSSASTVVQTSYPVTSASYQNNGKYIYSVPVASGSVTIYNQTGTIFTGASNSYTSLTVSSENTVISGLPSNIPTIINFIDTVSYIYPFSFIDSANLTENSNLIFNGHFGYQETTANNIISYQNFITNIGGTANPWYHIVYWGNSQGTTATSLYIQYYESGSWHSLTGSPSYSVSLNRWTSIWFGMSLDSIGTGINSVNYIRLNAVSGTFNITIGLAEEYNTNINFKNNPSNNYYDFYGNVYWITPFGTILASNQDLSFYFLTGNPVTILSSTQFSSDSNGYYFFESSSLYGSDIWSVVGNHTASLPFIWPYLSSQGAKSNGLMWLVYNTCSGSCVLQISNFVTEASTGFSISFPNILGLGADSATYFITLNAYDNSTFIGKYTSGDFIPKNLNSGYHVFSYIITSIEITNFEWKWGENNFYFLTNSTTGKSFAYNIASANLESLVFRNQQGSYINPDTFNCFYNNIEFIGGSFYVTDTSQSFNLTIADAWNQTIYTNSSETWTRIRDFTIILYNAKVQNAQPDPVWVNIQRGAGASFSQWVFPQEVISYWLLPATNYHIYYHFATVNSSYVSITNTTVVSYTFSLAADIAFRITGLTLNQVYSDINAVLGQANTIALQLNTVSATVNTTGTTVGLIFNVQNGNFSLLANNMTLINSKLDGNFTIITQTLNMLNTAFNGNFTAITKLMSFVNTTMQGNFSFVKDYITMIDTTMKGNFSSTNSIINLIYDVVNSSFVFTNSTLKGNFTFMINTLNMLNTAMNGNFSNVVSLLNLVNSSLTGNFSIETQTLNMLNTALHGNFTLISTTFNILQSSLKGNFTIIEPALTYLQGNITLESQFLTIMNSTLGGNITLIADFLQIMDSSLKGNFSNIIANTLSVLSNVASVNTTLLNSLAFQIQVNNIYLSDSYVNLYITATQNFNYFVFENNTQIASGYGIRAGTFIDYVRNSAIGVFIQVGIKFVNSTNSVWYNTSYNNADKQAIVLSITPPLASNDLLQMFVGSNYPNATYYINDSLVAGLQANWDSSGVFSWNVSKIYGTHYINVTARIDLNGDGKYTAKGETVSQIITWNYFQQDLVVDSVNFNSQFNKLVTVSFKSNYYGQNLTYFRIKPYNQSIWSDWMSEDSTNGSAIFDPQYLYSNQIYQFKLQVRALIQRSTPTYEFLNFTFYFTPTSNIQIITSTQPGANTPPAPSSSSDTSINSQLSDIRQQQQTNTWFQLIIFLIVIVGAIAPIIRYSRTGKEVIGENIQNVQSQGTKYAITKSTNFLNKNSNKQSSNLNKRKGH